jgi:23S rRNA (cytosine1962-C5)-methyltransferase
MSTASTADYELLDFGDGRKLERFGGVVLDRPSPAAEGIRRSRPELWSKATARFLGSRAGEGAWQPDVKTWTPPDWVFVHRGTTSFQLRLDALPSGQVGVFPEQRDNWDWIARAAKPSPSGRGQGEAAKPSPSGRGQGEGNPGSALAPTLSHGQRESPLRVLNLFAYTGGSTLAAAAAGAHVVHVDAARNIVERARENAALSNLADRPIRWIVEDAMKFCRRELKRGRRYDAAILDPPTYGHGPKGEPWKIGENLLPLLKLCGELTAESRAFVLVTCHSPGIGPAELAAYVAEGFFGHCARPPQASELFLETADHPSGGARRQLPSGVFARWSR